MPSNRREFLNLVTGAAVSDLLMSAPIALATSCAGENRQATPAHAPRPTIKAIAFDAFAIFDARPISALAEELFPGAGARLSDAWRARQFEYAWLRVTLQRYADFWQVTENALDFAAKMSGLNLDPEKRARLLRACLELKTWPDVPPALEALRRAGLRLALLSNFTPRMLDAAIARSGLEGVFEHVLSTDGIRTYKPDPRAYQMGMDAFGLGREEIAFIPSSGWDAAGAKWFGYTTLWVNRLHLPVEDLGAIPDATVGTLADVVKLVTS